MTDEMFEYLHMSIVQYYCRKNLPKEELHETLEELGYRVGYGLIEKIGPDTSRLTDDVSIMKYICKEFWIAVYTKQVDNLRTNNAGIFVLQDNHFRFLTQISAGKQYVDIVEPYLAFSCGLLRGALTNLGNTCVVTAEVQQMPVCRFQINLQAAQSSQQAGMMSTSVSSSQLASLNSSVASLSLSTTKK